jgi:hypothetical protein
LPIAELANLPGIGQSGPKTEVGRWPTGSAGLAMPGPLYRTPLYTPRQIFGAIRPLLQADQPCILVDMELLRSAPSSTGFAPLADIRVGARPHTARLAGTARWSACRPFRPRALTKEGGGP